MKLQVRTGTKARRGSALLYAAVIALTMGGLGLALFGMTLSTGKKNSATRVAQYSFYAAEAGLSDAFVRLNTGQLELVLSQLGIGESTQLGSEDAPLPLGSTAYWVEIERTNWRTYSVVSTGVDGDDRQRLRMMIGEAPNGLFQFAAFGDEGVELRSNALIDSYDSRAGAYGEGLPDGSLNITHNGDVGSNQDFWMRSNTTVYGDVIYGQGYSLNAHPTAYVSGVTVESPDPVELPPIEIPADIATTGNLSSTSDVEWGPGDIGYSAVEMAGGTTLRIVGPARVSIDSLMMTTGSTLVLDASGGPIDLWCGDDFILESNSTVVTTTNSAADVNLWLDAINMDVPPSQAETIQLSSNSEFVGAIYAPNASISLDSNFNIFGGVMAGELDLSSNGEIHFDDALRYEDDGAGAEYDVLLWQRMPDA